MSHITNTNNKQPRPHLPSLQPFQEPTPMLTPQIPIPPQLSSKPIPTHTPPSSSIQSYQNSPPKHKSVPRTSARLNEPKKINQSSSSIILLQINRLLIFSQKQYQNPNLNFAAIYWVYYY